MTPAIASRLPGAAESDCRASVSRGGTRWRMALTGGEQDRRPFAAFDAAKPRQRRHALRHDAGMRRDPVVRQAIPGRKFQHLDVGREEGERARQRRHARTVAADHGKADRGRRRPRSDRAREVGEHQTFGAVGNAGQKQRPAGREPLRRRPRRRSHLRRHAPPRRAFDRP